MLKVQESSGVKRDRSSIEMSSRRRRCLRLLGAMEKLPGTQMLNLHTQPQNKARPDTSRASLHLGLLQRKCDCGNHTTAGGECGGCKNRRESLQRSARNSESEARNPIDVPPIVHEVLRSPGQPLDAATRAFMEPRFGHDFTLMQTNTSRISPSDLTVGAVNDPLEREADNLAESVLRIPPTSQSALSTQRAKADFTRVRIHTDARAADSSRAVNARAYTVGQDIVFGPAGYAPNTYAGQKLLAHELVHTLQQSGNRRSAIVRRQPSPSGPAQSPPTPPAPTPSPCISPTGIRLGTSHTLSFPGFLTGGGICSVMEAQPVSNLCSSVPEQVTSATGNCPASLITGGICSGSSNFTIGRNQVRACAAVTMPPNGFVDRHTINIQNVSVLHDPTRNPAGLNSCSCTCDQQYFAGTSRTPIGRFQIRYDLAKATRGTQNITSVTATKTTVPI